MNEESTYLSGSSSSQIGAIIERIKVGDPTAREALLRVAERQLRGLTRRMLRGFPGVARWEQTDDVLQGVLIRLMRALEDVTLDDPESVFRLAGMLIRRELIDLARHYSGPLGLGTHISDVSLSTIQGESLHPGDQSSEPSLLASWTEFHEQAARLPEEERKMFDLLFYQGLTQDEAAEVLGVTGRTVRNRWQKARLKLIENLQGRLPGM